MNLALTLGLLVDTSRSQSNVLDAERNASRSFFDQMLAQPKDKAFLIHFDREVELLQDLTSSHEKLQAALDLLKTPSDREHSNDPNDDDTRSGSHHGGTQLYDAVFLASNELMKKQPGRKALIVLTDGVDRGSKTYLEGAIESAQPRIPSSTRFISPTSIAKITATGRDKAAWAAAVVIRAAAGPAADIPGAADMEVAAADSGGLKSRTPMGRKF